jgi:lysozyme
MNELLEKLRALLGNKKAAPSSTSPLHSIANPRFGEAQGPSAGTTDQALRMIMQSEGFEANAYKDKGDKPTIGYGTTGPNIKMGMPAWTKEQARDTARKHLAGDSAYFAKKGVTAPPEVLSATYNMGKERFRKTGALDALLAGDYEGVADAIEGINTVKGKFDKGVANRRAGEVSDLRAIPQRNFRRYLTGR